MSLDQYRSDELDIRCAASRLWDEERERKELVARSVPYGMTYLSDALIGLLPTDVVLLGSETGGGKTEMATGLAMAASRAGRKVVKIVLEEARDSIERRVLYRCIMDAAWSDPQRPHDLSEVNYARWFHMQCENTLKKYKFEGFEAADKLLSNITTIYRNKNFGATHLGVVADLIGDETDLVILDHFHYLDTDDPSENRAQKDLIKQIRDAALNSKKPWVVVAHLRKRQGNGVQNKLVPNMEDFMGSSDLAKIATVGILIAPAWDQPLVGRHKYGTYVSVAKDRMDGSLKRYIGLVTFDPRTNEYDKQYIVGTQQFKQVERRWEWQFEPCKGSSPTWAVHDEGVRL